MVFVSFYVSADYQCLSTAYWVILTLYINGTSIFPESIDKQVGALREEHQQHQTAHDSSHNYRSYLDLTYVVEVGTKKKLRLTILVNLFQHNWKTILQKKTRQRKGRKRATRREGRRNSTNHHVKSIISPGVKKGLSSFFSFFFGRSLSFECLPRAFLILSTSAWHLWTSAWKNQW